uniref:ATP-dependent Clp protease proteolytic subunit n=1 Tax=Paulinella longichromatophora TaxID=1708747 RepID=A0A2H4ZPF6_9EUKA|nr:Clp protease proteolytic subunit [Paulinella longichromatophora]
MIKSQSKDLTLVNQSIRKSSMKEYNMSIPHSKPFPMNNQQIEANNSKYTQSKPAENRIITISEDIDDEGASFIIGQLLMMEAESPEEDIYVYINCMGGSMYGFMGIYDTIQEIKPDVVTLCYGSAFEMSAFLLSGGAKGKRLALPNSRIMLNQPETSFYGCITDLQLYNQELMIMRKNICSLIAAHTGQRFEKVTADTNRDQFFSAAEAIEYGLIDRILYESL